MPRTAPRGIDATTATDAADLLGVPVARVVWHCQRAAAVGRASFFWGCWQQDGEWMIPGRAMRRALSAWPLQHYSIDEAAALTGLRPRTLRARCYVVPGGMDPARCLPAGMIAARLFFGSDLRIPESELSRLAAGLVGRLEQPKTGCQPRARSGNAFGRAGRVVNGAGRGTGSAPAAGPGPDGHLVVCNHSTSENKPLIVRGSGGRSPVVVTEEIDSMGGEGVGRGGAGQGTNDPS